MRKLFFVLLVSLCLAATSVNDSGTWRTVVDVYVNDAGTWRRIQEIYVNDGGTWRLVHVGDIVNVPLIVSSCTEFSPSSASTQIQFRADGQAAKVECGGGLDIQGNWITPTSNAANYELRATLSSGSAPSSGDALNVWHAMTSTRTWNQFRGTNGITTTNLLIEIRRASDGTVVASGTVTLIAEREP